MESSGEVCFDERWSIMGACAVIGILFYVLLPPLRVLTLGKESALHETLFQKYKLGKEWYEAAMMALKAGSAVVGVLFTTFPLFQLLAALIMQTLSYTILIRERPYLEARDGTLDAVLLLATIAQLLVGLLAYVGAPDGLVIAMIAPVDNIVIRWRLNNVAAFLAD